MLLREVESLVGTGKYQEALPYFDEILVRFQGLNDAEAKKGIAKTIYFRSRCLLELNRLPEARDGFEKYLKENPQGEDRVDTYFLLADTLARMESWEQVVVTVERCLVEFPKIGEDLKLIANQMKGDANFRLNRWNEAVEPLTFVFQRTKDDQTRNLAGTMIMAALMQAGDLDKVFQYIPMIYRTTARYDPVMNLSMLDVADKYANKGDYTRAIALYRLVYSKNELSDFLAKRIESVKAEIEQLNKTAGPRPTPAARARFGMLKRMLPQLEEQQKQLEKQEPWDKDLQVRIGIAYTKLQRYWESLILNRNIYEADPNHPEAHHALYGSFQAAMELGDLDQAMAEGKEYMVKYPDGEYWDAVVAAMANLFFEKSSWDKVIELVTLVQEKKPDANSLSYLLILKGASYFYKEEFQKAYDAFTAGVKLGDASEYASTAEYWQALSSMFMERYAEALKLFQAYVAKHKQFGEADERYQDAMFRIAMAHYGMNNKEETQKAADQLKLFVEKFPDNALVPEALNLLGDILASLEKAELNEAINCYKRAVKVAVSQAPSTNQVKMVYVDYATIQQARVLELEGRYDEIVKLMQEYLDTWGAQGNFAEAIYWLGTAKTKMKKVGEAYEHFLNGIIRFGNDPKLDSVDMILRDMIKASSDPEHPAEFAKIREKLYSEMIKARARDDQKTLYLRLTALFAETEPDPARRDVFMRQIMQDENIPAASTLVLDLMGREALKKNNMDLAEKVFRYFMKHYPDSDLGVSAFRWFIEHYIKNSKYDDANALLTEVIGRWGKSDAGGWARMREADILRMQKQYAKAIGNYKEILKEREWKALFWPEALFGVGQCHMELGQFNEATLMFTRIYTLYEPAVDWSAPAYLKAAECLVKQDKSQDAIKELQKMLGKKRFAGRPELEKAREEIKRLGGSPEGTPAAPPAVTTEKGATP